MYAIQVPISVLAMMDDISNIVICNSVNANHCNVSIDKYVKCKKLENQVRKKSVSGSMLVHECL